MKLIKRVEQGVRSVFPAVSIQKSGTMRFNNPFVRELKIKAGDKLAFFQDADKPTDWYIKPDPEGITLRNGTGTSGGIIIQSSSIANDFIRSVKLDKGVTIPISTDPVEGGYYALITKKVMKN